MSYAIDEYDDKVDKEIFRIYDGLEIERYASGFEFGTGKREILYDIKMKDGSKFVAEARYDTEDFKIDITERYE